MIPEQRKAVDSAMNAGPILCSDGGCFWMNMSADFGETHGKKQGKVMKLGEDLIFVFFLGGIWVI